MTVLALSASASAVLQVNSLRCEYLVDPLGIDKTTPRLSWVVDSPTRGDKQTAWQVIVASTPEGIAGNQGDLWDSGMVTGDDTSQITYAGSALTSRSACYWKVRAWDKDGTASAWSSPAKWTVGLLQNSDWSAKWIDGHLFTADASSDMPVILSASYRGTTTGSGSLDVKAQLTAMLALGNQSFSVTNETFGSDPAYNVVKQLVVQYQRGGFTFSQTFAEKASVILPTSLPGMNNSVVVSARYESVANPTTAFSDVTTKLTSKPAGPYSIVVNNTNFGPDPAVNQVKRLRVNFTVNGVAGMIFKAENSTFSFPSDLPTVAATLTGAHFEAIDGTVSVDVMSKMTGLAANGPYSTTVTSTYSGSDPAPNHVKRLRLDFVRDGRAWVKYIAEGKTFNFPGDLAQADDIPYLRKTFTLSKPVRSALLYTTALGVYEMQLNGSRVGDHILAPEWTNYTKRLNYQVYDVTSQLVPGTNAIGAQLANGWYSGNVGNGGVAYWGTSAGLLSQLEITYQDGSTDRVVTDGTWKMAPGPLIATDNFLGEEYDATREIANWSSGSLDDSSWTHVLLRSEIQRIMNGQRMEPVRKHMELTPKSVTQPATGKWTYDLGQNMVGVVRLKITALAGTKITIRQGERLNTGGAGSDGPVGTVYVANLRNAPSIDHYTCKGGGEEIWQPKFTFHGFQYVELTGLASQPPLDAVTGIVFSSDIAPTGQFACSDGFVNQLQSNIQWGQRGNYLSVPTDCPQRDERLGWTGDAEVFIKTASYNADIAAFFTKWLTDMLDAQRTDGTVSDVVPDTGVGGGTPAWNDALTICPWTIYQAYGDKQILANCYTAMKGWVEYCHTNSTNSIRDKGRGSDFGDWLSINADTSKELIGTAYYAYSTRILAKSAAVLGNTADATTYEALFQTIKTAFNNKYVNQTTGAFIGTGTSTQCSYLMALKFDLLPTNLRPLVTQLLENDIISNGNHLSTGFVGVSYLLPVLMDGGKTSTAYNLLMQDTFPSWLFSVKNGATTIWERWDGWTPTAGFQSTTMNSFNHYSLGSCGEWLFGSVAGISQDSTSAGYKNIIIHPQPGGPLTSASGSFRSIHGVISSSWRTYSGGFALEATVPANTTAVVYVPATDSTDVKESGMPVANVAGITYLGMESGAAKFAVGAGRYSFTSGTGIEPGTDSVSHDSGAPLNMRISTLIGNDGGGPFTFVSAGPTSINGGTITVADGWITYTPLPGSTGPDSFTYIIRDASGGLITRTVQVGIIPPDAPVQTVQSMTTMPDQSRKVQFAGISGRIYRIQSSETLSNGAAWTTRATLQADEDGSFSFTDAMPLPAARFYRAVYP